MKGGTPPPYLLTDGAIHSHRIDLDTLLAIQTARKVKQPTIDEMGQRKMADYPSYY